MPHSSDKPLLIDAMQGACNSCAAFSILAAAQSAIAMATGQNAVADLR
jgi:hypothetical protein